MPGLAESSDKPHDGRDGPVGRHHVRAARRHRDLRPPLQPPGDGLSRSDNRAVEPGDVVAELWRRIQARDWDAVAELIAEDFVLEWPNARVRIRGRTNFVEFNRRYPEGWSIEVLRIVAQGNTAVSEVHVPHPTVGPYYALSFFTVEGDRLTSGREYWVEERYEEPAADRARWFEPM